MSHCDFLIVPKRPHLFVKLIGFEQENIKHLKQPSLSKLNVLNFYKAICLSLLFGLENNFENLLVFTEENEKVEAKFDIIESIHFQLDKNKTSQIRFFSKSRFLQKSPFFFKLGSRKPSFNTVKALLTWIDSIDLNQCMATLKSFKKRNLKSNTQESFFTKRELYLLKLHFSKIKSTLFEILATKKRLNLIEFAKIIRPDLE